MLEPGLAGLVVVTAVLAEMPIAVPQWRRVNACRQHYGWSSIDGVAAVPIMAIIMLMASRKSPTGEFALTKRLAALGWLTTATSSPSCRRCRRR